MTLFLVLVVVYTSSQMPALNVMPVYPEWIVDDNCSSCAS